MDVNIDQVVVKVQNLNIDAFDSIFVDLLRTHDRDFVRLYPFEFHVCLTENSLSTPDSAPLAAYANRWTGLEVYRFTQIQYIIKPISLIYVDKLQAILDDQYFERKDFVMDPESDYLMEVFKQACESREIISQEDQDKGMVGNWAKGEFVIKEGHEWEGFEYDDEGDFEEGDVNEH